MSLFTVVNDFSKREHQNKDVHFNFECKMSLRLISEYFQYERRLPLSMRKYNDKNFAQNMSSINYITEFLFDTSKILHVITKNYNPSQKFIKIDMSMPITSVFDSIVRQSGADPLVILMLYNSTSFYKDIKNYLAFAYNKSKPLVNINSEECILVMYLDFFKPNISQIDPAFKLNVNFSQFFVLFFYSLYYYKVENVSNSLVQIFLQNKIRAIIKEKLRQINFCVFGIPYGLSPNSVFFDTASDTFKYMFFNNSFFNDICPYYFVDPLIINGRPSRLIPAWYHNSLGNIADANHISIINKRLEISSKNAYIFQEYTKFVCINDAAIYFIDKEFFFIHYESNLPNSKVQLILYDVSDDNNILEQYNFNYGVPLQTKLDPAVFERIGKITARIYLIPVNDSVFPMQIYINNVLHNVTNINDAEFDVAITAKIYANMQKFFAPETQLNYITTSTASLTLVSAQILKKDRSNDVLYFYNVPADPTSFKNLENYLISMPCKLNFNSFYIVSSWTTSKLKNLRIKLKDDMELLFQDMVDINISEPLFNKNVGSNLPVASFIKFSIKGGPVTHIVDYSESAFFSNMWNIEESGPSKIEQTNVIFNVDLLPSGVLAHLCAHDLGIALDTMMSSERDFNLHVMKSDLQVFNVSSTIIFNQNKDSFRQTYDILRQLRYDIQVQYPITLKNYAQINLMANLYEVKMSTLNHRKDILIYEVTIATINGSSMYDDVKIYYKTGNSQIFGMRRLLNPLEYRVDQNKMYARIVFQQEVDLVGAFQIMFFVGKDNRFICGQILELDYIDNTLPNSTWTYADQ